MKFNINIHVSLSQTRVDVCDFVQIAIKEKNQLLLTNEELKD